MGDGGFVEGDAVEWDAHVPPRWTSEVMAGSALVWGTMRDPLAMDTLLLVRSFHLRGGGDGDYMVLPAMLRASDVRPYPRESHERDVDAYTKRQMETIIGGDDR